MSAASVVSEGGGDSTLPHLAAQEVTAAYVSDPTSFSSSCSPALKKVAEHFTSITTNPYFSELALDWRTEHIHRALTEAPTPDTATSIPNITLLPRAAGRHSQRSLTQVLQHSAIVAFTRSSSLPLDVKCSISQSSQHGAGLFLSTVPSTVDLRLTDQEFLQNYWHRFVWPPTPRRAPSPRRQVLCLYLPRVPA